MSEPKDPSDTTLTPTSFIELREHIAVTENTKEPPQRRPDGTMLPGNTANPTGHRARLPATVKAMLIDATPAAARAYIEALSAVKQVVVNDGKEAGSHIEEFPDHGIRIQAATAILDRVCGKPTQAVTGEDGGPVQVDVGIIGVLRRLAGEESQ